ncbi:hypothetical protein HNY73_009819 [Argiope bruennichi]|uniref:Uncharacterized protein n=1 Tax=Argiope bruennichi TaxID=94029 RepID=A0A8T0FAL3_ARGBR|nr:hypothetical protein HNY73_009819 [Argiope bruennichi]
MHGPGCLRKGCHVVPRVQQPASWEDGKRIQLKKGVIISNPLTKEARLLSVIYIRRFLALEHPKIDFQSADVSSKPFQPVRVIEVSDSGPSDPDPNIPMMMEAGRYFLRHKLHLDDGIQGNSKRGRNATQKSYEQKGWSYEEPFCPAEEQLGTKEPRNTAGWTDSKENLSSLAETDRKGPSKIQRTLDEEEKKKKMLREKLLSMAQVAEMVLGRKAKTRESTISSSTTSEQSEFLEKMSTILMETTKAEGEPESKRNCRGERGVPYIKGLLGLVPRDSPREFHEGSVRTGSILTSGL